MMFSRRSFVCSLLIAAGGRLVLGHDGRAFAETQAKAAASRRPAPFSRFTDVAREAGLTAPTIYGGVEHDIYIIESIGGGCAFFDYDNDGWMDIFILGGTRLEGPPRARPIAFTKTTVMERSRM